VKSISFGPDGSLYLLHQKAIYVSTMAIRRVGPDGVMSKVAGMFTPNVSSCLNMAEGRVRRM